MNRIQLKELSKSQLKGSWKMPILFTVIYLGVTMILSYIDESVFSIIPSLIMLLLIFAVGIWATVGIPNFYLEFINKGGEVKLSDSLVSSEKLIKSLVYNIIVCIVSFIVSFILIFAIAYGTVYALFVSGDITILAVFLAIVALAVTVGFVILAIAWAQTPYIIVDKNLGAIESMKLSMKMMKGRKWEYFVLELSFIGWGILSILTFGIGFLWLVPYLTLTVTNYYRSLDEDDYVTLKL